MINTKIGLTEKQSDLLLDVGCCEGENTHQIAEFRGDHQAYETNLRDRLFYLAKCELVRFIECIGCNDGVIERRWYTV